MGVRWFALMAHFALAVRAQLLFHLPVPFAHGLVPLLELLLLAVELRHLALVVVLCSKLTVRPIASPVTMFRVSYQPCGTVLVLIPLLSRAESLRAAVGQRAAMPPWAALATVLGTRGHEGQIRSTQNKLARRARNSKAAGGAHRSRAVWAPLTGPLTGRPSRRTRELGQK